MEQEEAERNMQILLDFLQHLHKQKVDELNAVSYYRFQQMSPYIFEEYIVLKNI